ncbi:MAG TPA: diaminobutyrate--2-oxoglutarate transaminase [Symbiobacteriaceae bacterium]|nr:diaminobutyrate--2-oxoglutarate transaminase [Symbiobacteriaceae bacterium]
MPHEPVAIVSFPGPMSAPYIEKQARCESNARTYPRHIPLAVVKADGIHVWDADHRVYIDCLAGAGTLALGHNHPVVIEAIRDVLQSGQPLHTLDLMTPAKDKFVDELFASLPPAFARNARIQFCGPSGADAVEAALKLVKTVTKRRTILAFQGAYHGMTHGALSVTGSAGVKQKIANLMPDVHFLPFPYAYRCPFGVGGEATHQISSRYIERVLDDPESGITPPAGMILEVVQGEGGSIPAPDEWVREMRRITRARDIPLIVDEIQAGLCRTGTFFAFERSGITPDVILISKAIGGGLPLSVMVYKGDLDLWDPGAHVGTFRGNVLAMAAGTASLRLMREQGLARHASDMGEQFLRGLSEVARGTHCIGEIRGRGLMIGVEIVDKQGQPDLVGTYPAHPHLAQRIHLECLKRGLIIELGGRHGSVTRFLPPLIITADQVDTVTAIFGDAVRAAEASM